MLHIKIGVTLGGASVQPNVLLGVLSGATVVGRVRAYQTELRSTQVSQDTQRLSADFIVSGLTPGSITLDAAYGIESTNGGAGSLRWGGPNNTTDADAYGAFEFVISDPRPLPVAAPGASDGVLIAGSNAATSVQGLSSAGDFNLANVSVEGSVVVAPDGDNHAVTLLASGSGHGLYAAGAGGGHGIYGAGGDGGGDGIHGEATGADGHGLAGIGEAGGHGMRLAGGGAGDGLNAVPGGSGVGTFGIRAEDGILGSLVGSVYGDLEGSVTGNLGGDVQGDLLGTVGALAGGVSVSSIAAGTITAASIADGALTAAKFAANAITAAAVAADVGTEIAAAVWAYVHETGRTAKGVLVRLDALMTGKGTGLRSSIARFFRADGTTVAIQASQNIAAGTREAASSVSGD
jgi:hypothetical protein